MNKADLIGRFAKDPELRYTDTGKAVCNFTLAVRNPFSPNQEADFILCVAWGQVGELIADKHLKGHMIGVSGRIAPRWWEDSEGKRIYITEINVTDITLIQTKESPEHQETNNQNNSNTRSNSSNSRSNSSNNSNTQNRSNSRSNNNRTSGSNQNSRQNP